MKRVEGRMIRRFISLLCFGMVFIISIVSAVPELSEGEGEGLYIIVNVDNSIDSVTINQLSRVFNKKVKEFENGIASLPVAQKSSRPVAREFNRRILKKNAKQLKYYWARKMFSGSSKPPKYLASDTEVVKFVASVKNAVGYVSQKPNHKNVKVILIEP